MTLRAVEKFNAMTGMVKNIKDQEGVVISPVAYHCHNYEDQEGKTHQVLVLKDGKSGELYKTETQAFIKKFLQYDEAFGDLPDEEKPDIAICFKDSKRGYKYVNFEVMDKAE